MSFFRDAQILNECWRLNIEEDSHKQQLNDTPDADHSTAYREFGSTEFRHICDRDMKEYESN